MRLFGKKKTRVCVVGIDGVPYTLLKQFMADGVTPRINEIAEGRNFKQMKVTLPEISSVSWSSFMTGTNPGQHGIFGFVDLRPNTYQMSFPSFRNLSAPTIWETLGRKGKRSVVINQPATYPAKKLEGAMISGFVALDLPKAVFPRPIERDLKKMGYMIDIDTMECRSDSDRLFKELDQSLATRKEACEFLWKREEWDFLELIITGTDRLQHYIWDAIADQSNPLHERAMEYYGKVDTFVGEIYDRFCKETGTDGAGFMMLSDHGFTGIKTEVYLNNWLMEEGFLGFETDQPKSVADITRETKAFTMDPGRIFINFKGKFPKGNVKVDESEAIKSTIREKLMALEYKGEKVIEQVFDRKEIYHGPNISDAADLIVLSNHGFDLKGSCVQKEIFGHSGLQGMHTWDDAFLITDAQCSDEPHITELAKLIVGQLE